MVIVACLHALVDRSNCAYPQFDQLYPITFIETVGWTLESSRSHQLELNNIKNICIIKIGKIDEDKSLKLSAVLFIVINFDHILSR